MSESAQSLALNRHSSVCSDPPGTGWTGGEARQAQEMRGSQMSSREFISDATCSVTSPASFCGWYRCISIRQRRGLEAQVLTCVPVFYTKSSLSLQTCTGPVIGETGLIISPFASSFKCVFEAFLPDCSGESCVNHCLLGADPRYPSTQFTASVNLARRPP